MTVHNNISIEAPSVASANSHSLLLQEKGSGRKAVQFDISLNWEEEEQRAQRGHEARRRSQQLHKAQKIFMSDPHEPPRNALSILANSANAIELATIYARGQRNLVGVPAEDRAIYKKMRKFFKIVRRRPRVSIGARLDWLSAQVGLPPNHDVPRYYNGLNNEAKLALGSLNMAFVLLDSPTLRPLPAVVSQGSGIGDGQP